MIENKLISSSKVEVQVKYLSQQEKIQSVTEKNKLHKKS